MSDDLYNSVMTEDVAIVRYLFELEEANLVECLDEKRPARPVNGKEETSLSGDIATHLLHILRLIDRAADGLTVAGQCLAACRRLGDVRGEANVLAALGDVKLREADLSGARRDYETALPILHRPVPQSLEGETRRVESETV